MTSDEDLPFCVFIDTQVYRAASFDWTQHNFATLRERVARGSIELVTTDIVMQELRRGLGSTLNEFGQRLEKAVQYAGVVRPLEDQRVGALHSLNEIKPDLASVWSSAEQFLRQVSTTIIDIPDTALTDAFNLYFSGDPPFGGKNKKAEFPDAVNMIALLAHARSAGKPIYVVSADDDWKRACAKHEALLHVTHLSEILDKAIRAEWLSTDLWSDKELLGFIQAKADALKPQLERALEVASTVNLGDGQIGALTIEHLYLDGFAVTDIDERADVISFRGELFHTVGYSAYVWLEDAEMGYLLEDMLSGEQELVAVVEIKLPLANPSDIDIVSVDYLDGLNVMIPIKYLETGRRSQ